MPDLQSLEDLSRLFHFFPSYIACFFCPKPITQFYLSFTFQYYYSLPVWFCDSYLKDTLPTFRHLFRCLLRGNEIHRDYVDKHDKVTTTGIVWWNELSYCPLHNNGNVYKADIGLKTGMTQILWHYSSHYRVRYALLVKISVRQLSDVLLRLHSFYMGCCWESPLKPHP